jgi:hypothetical protein
MRILWTQSDGMRKPFDPSVTHPPLRRLEHDLIARMGPDMLNAVNQRYPGLDGG